MRDFNHSIGVLVKAYFNNTLKHVDCKACAVGNLMQGNGIRFNSYDESTFWLVYIYSKIRNSYCTHADGYSDNEALRQIYATGYTPYELSLIEDAFEKAECSDGDYMFAGLMAVLDILSEIHGIPLQEKETARKLFLKTI